MSRPPLEVADLIRTAGAAFVGSFRPNAQQIAFSANRRSSLKVQNSDVAGFPD